jgi:hypothetical protein
MSDNDLIRRGDADAAIVKCGGNGATRQFCRDAIRALPAADPMADPRVQALVEALDWYREQDRLALAAFKGGEA